MSQKGHSERIISAVAAGFFFILVGVIFLSTPGLADKIAAFFRDFNIVTYPTIGNVLIPAPATVNAHLDVYMAAQKFSLIWGVFQIFTLALRFAFHSLPRSKAQNISDIIFSLGNSYLISFFLNPQVTLMGWLVYWSMVITLFGVSLITRAVTLAILAREKQKPLP
jgi:hypothetical protein